MRPPLASLPESDNANYAGVYVSGPLTGRLCVLDHEESTDIAPAYRSVRSFLAANIAAGEADRGWSEMDADYPEVVPSPHADLAADDWAAVQALHPLFEAADDRDDRGRWEREHYAFSIMALTPFAHTSTLYRFVNDGDMHIQAYACRILGQRRLEEAVPLLADVAERGTHNGRIAALDALGEIGTSACLTRVLHLIAVLPPGWEMHLADALKGCGCDTAHDAGQWRYRLPGSEQWAPLQLG